jgi:hypothetical protein
VRPGTRSCSARAGRRHTLHAPEARTAPRSSWHRSARRSRARASCPPRRRRRRGPTEACGVSARPRPARRSS